MLKKLPIGIQTFSVIIEEGYTYVDKTAQIYDIVSTGKYYFLSRPRRFGKSLLVSTLKELFSGNRELFKGLAIDSLSWEWERYSVVQISFASIANETPEALKQSLLTELRAIAAQHNVTLSPNLLPGDALKQFVILLATQTKVALLIDEYDYAILRHVHTPAVADQMREVLLNFYSVIKDLDPYLRFVFLTGVSKFSKTSIFSGLNNLQDITLDERAAMLLGYTKSEILQNFPDYLSRAAKELNISERVLIDDIRDWYDGYWFTKKVRTDDERMYNPFSVLNFLQKCDFSNYWFASGTPTFLINLIKTKKYPILDLEQVEVTESDLDAFNMGDISLKALMFQTGYLTIKRYIPERRRYVLGYPNKETSLSLVEHIFVSMTGAEMTYVGDVAFALKNALVQHNAMQLKDILTKLYATVPYTIHIDEEKYYQTIFYFILKMASADIIVEDPTNIGRIDAVLQTADTTFIIEFKMNVTAKKALQQIIDKKYAQKYQGSGKTISLVGIAFDMKLKNVSDVAIEKG